MTFISLLLLLFFNDDTVNYCLTTQNIINDELNSNAPSCPEQYIKIYQLNQIKEVSSFETINIFLDYSHTSNLTISMTDIYNYSVKSFQFTGPSKDYLLIIYCNESVFQPLVFNNITIQPTNNDSNQINTECVLNASTLELNDANISIQNISLVIYTFTISCSPIILAGVTLQAIRYNFDVTKTENLPISLNKIFINIEPQQILVDPTINFTGFSADYLMFLQDSSLILTFDGYGSFVLNIANTSPHVKYMFNHLDFDHFCKYFSSEHPILNNYIDFYIYGTSKPFIIPDMCSTPTRLHLQGKDIAIEINQYDSKHLYFELTRTENFSLILSDDGDSSSFDISTFIHSYSNTHIINNNKNCFKRFNIDSMSINNIDDTDHYIIVDPNIQIEITGTFTLNGKNDVINVILPDDHPYLLTTSANVHLFSGILNITGIIFSRYNDIYISTQNDQLPTRVYTKYPINSFVAQFCYTGTTVPFDYDISPIVENVYPLFVSENWSNSTKIIINIGISSVVDGFSNQLNLIQYYNMSTGTNNEYYGIGMKLIDYPSKAQSRICLIDFEGDVMRQNETCKDYDYQSYILDINDFTQLLNSSFKHRVVNYTYSLSIYFTKSPQQSDIFDFDKLDLLSGKQIKVSFYCLVEKNYSFLNENLSIYFRKSTIKLINIMYIRTAIMPLNVRFYDETLPPGSNLTLQLDSLHLISDITSSVIQIDETAQPVMYDFLGVLYISICNTFDSIYTRIINKLTVVIDDNLSGVHVRSDKLWFTFADFSASFKLEQFKGILLFKISSYSIPFINEVKDGSPIPNFNISCTSMSPRISFIGKSWPIGCTLINLVQDTSKNLIIELNENSTYLPINVCIDNIINVTFSNSISQTNIPETVKIATQRVVAFSELWYASEGAIKNGLKNLIFQKIIFDGYSMSKFDCQYYQSVNKIRFYVEKFDLASQNNFILSGIHILNQAIVSSHAVLYFNSSQFSESSDLTLYIEKDHMASIAFDEQDLSVKIPPYNLYINGTAFNSTDGLYPIVKGVGDTCEDWKSSITSDWTELNLSCIYMPLTNFVSLVHIQVNPIPPSKKNKTKEILIIISVVIGSVLITLGIIYTTWKLCRKKIFKFTFLKKKNSSYSSVFGSQDPLL